MEATDAKIVDMPPFGTRTQRLSMWAPQIVWVPVFSPATELHISRVVRTIRPSWGFISSLNTGKHFAIPVNIGLNRDWVFFNELSASPVYAAWGIGNRLSMAALNPAWAVENELIDSDYVQKEWVFKTTIGTDELAPVYEFFGQGPVIHREGSHGGYE